MGRYQGGQRFKKYRQHSMVTPGVSGLLFTIDPHQAGKAIRETQLLLENYEASYTPEDDVQVEEVQENQEAAAPVASLSSLLAAELEAEKEEKVKLKKGSSKRTAVLDTNCKGYIFFRVPRPQGKSAEEDDESANEDEIDADDQPADEIDGEELPEKRKRQEEGNASNAQPEPTANAADAGGEEKDTQKKINFVPNPNVDKLIEALYTDLKENPRPVTRFTHRMIPVQLTCFPTESSLVPAIKTVLEGLTVPEGRSAIRIGVNFIVRNNSNADKESRSLKLAVERCLPMNKFLVLEPRGKVPPQLDAMLHICIMHSTACVGISEQHSDRWSFNLHDASKAALTLGRVDLTSGGEAA